MKLVTFSFDDGHILDIKAAEIMLKYKVKGTFYLTFYRYYPRITPLHSFYKTIYKELEIGSHALIHKDLRAISQVDLEFYISKKPYEDFFQGEIKMFASPWGYYNERIINCLRTEEKYLGARTTIVDLTFTFPKDPFKMNVSMLKGTLPRFVDFKDIFDQFLKVESGVFHLATHVSGTQDFGDFEKICKYIQDSNVISLTNSEILENKK